MFVKTIGTLLLLSGVCQAQTLPNFDLSLLTLASQLKEGLSDDAFTFTYDYQGPDDANLEVQFKLYDADCVNELVASALSEKALPVVDGIADTITNIVSVDLSTIVSDSTWSDAGDADATTFAITYCARLELYYGNDDPGQTKTFVNYHETNVVATVTMTEATGFELVDVEYELVEDVIGDQAEAVQVDYTLAVSHCDAAGTISVAPGNMVINQGEPIYLCVGYSGVDDVYVQDIWDFAYFAVDKDDGVGNPSGTFSPVLLGEKQNLATIIDCVTKPDFCIIGFYVDGTLFDGNAENLLEDRIVKITGTALISFGADLTTRKLLDFRELTENGGTRQQAFAGEAGEFTPRPHGAKPKPRHNFAFVVVGAVGSLLAVFGLAYYERKRREKFTKAKEVIVVATEPFHEKSNENRGQGTLPDVEV